MANTNTNVYKDSKHTEFRDSELSGPVAFGSTAIQNIYHRSSSRTDDALGRFAEAYCADNAAFNSRRLEHEPTCLADTRVDLLDDIMRWFKNSSGPRIFWLSGMAGTGKSTIARTVARSWDDKNQLGASFFFSRGQGDLAHASKFFATVAYQLARSKSRVAAHIRKAIRDYPDITKQNLHEQWKHLILEPLSRALRLQPLVLVIDALDECDNQYDVALILQLVSQANTSARLRVFVTSRPETPIRYGFSKISATSHRDCILHEIASQIVNRDISAFFRHELANIRRRRHLPSEWPDEASLDCLVQKADGLFIYAATLCRFVEHNRCYPPDRLKSVLQDCVEIGSPTQQLDEIYTKVLRSAVPDEDALILEGERHLNLFKRTVGTIVILFDALTAPALVELLDTRPGEVEEILESLSSVVGYSNSPDVPIKLLHPSFRDFLLDNQRCSDPRFRIVGENAHEDLAASCLKLMSRHLKQDICSLKRPGTVTSEVDPCTLQRCVPQDVRYACRYWVDHLQRSNVGLRDCDNDSKPLHNLVHSFFKEHFLHWLEALSLMESLHEGVLMVRALDSMLSSNKNQHLRAMAHDAVRFVLNFRSIIEIAPLQIYFSALVLSPTGSTVRQQFSKCIPGWINSLPRIREDWDSTLQVLAGHSGTVCQVVFSPDGKLLASASHDNKVRLWASTTGTCHATLEGHSGWVRHVAFSPDGTLLASASDDNTVRLWDSMTGTCYATLEGHSGTVFHVAFSPEGKLLASASSDNTVRLWDWTTGTCHTILEGHSNDVNSVAFSPDGKLLASASSDNTVRLWDSRTGTCHATLEGHSRLVFHVAFSPDSKLLASASYDSAVRLWDSTTGACHTILEGHSNDVNSVAFSPDGNLLASASDDNTVRLWDSTTGTCHSTLEGHSGTVFHVAFSPDGKLVASASEDNTVRLWDSTTGTCHSTLEGHSGMVFHVAFSPDGKLLASASYDNTARLWDSTTGTCQTTLEGHSDTVRRVAFSPDGKLLASASSDNAARLWDSTTGTCHATLEGHSNYVNSVAFSPDGKLLASASYDNTVRLWDLTTGTCHATLEGHSNYVNSVAFSPDGKLLASASYDNTVRLWDSTTGTCHATLEGHSNDVNSVAFSLDGKLLASASDDRTVRLWDSKTRTCLATFRGHSDWVVQVVFSPDGKRIKSTCRDQSIRFWDVDTMAESQAVNAKEIANSQLTMAGGWIFLEMQRLFLLPPDYQPYCFAVQGGFIALGYRSGRVCIIGFDADSVSLGGLISAESDLNAGQSSSLPQQIRAGWRHRLRRKVTRRWRL